MMHADRKPAAPIAHERGKQCVRQRTGLGKTVNCRHPRDFVASSNWHGRDAMRDMRKSSRGACTHHKWHLRLRSQREEESCSATKATKTGEEDECCYCSCQPDSTAYYLNVVGGVAPLLLLPAATCFSNFQRNSNLRSKSDTRLDPLGIWCL